MSKKYFEFKAFVDNGEVIKDKLTKRGSVMIDEYTAEQMNMDVDKTKVFYELAEEEKSIKKMNKQELIDYAMENDIVIDPSKTKGEIILVINEYENN